MDPTAEIEIYLRGKGVQRAVLKDMLDTFAHDLAEAIRVAAGEEIEKQGERTNPGDPKYDIAAGMVRAADLIDPEMK